ILKQVEDFVKGIEDALKYSKVAPMMRSVVDNFLGMFGDSWTMFLDGYFVPEFASANAEAFIEFRKRVKEIGEQFKLQIDDIETGLKRNQSSYMDYLNSIEDAEKQRREAELEAYKQYKESLIEAQDVFRDAFAGGFKEVLSISTEALKGFNDFMMEGFFGTLEDRVGNLIGRLSGINVSEKIRDLSGIMGIGAGGWFSRGETDESKLAKEFKTVVDGLKSVARALESLSELQKEDKRDESEESGPGFWTNAFAASGEAFIS